MTTGENAGTWGTNTNLNLNYLRDTFGWITIAMTADRTLTIPDNSTGTYDGRAFIIELTGTLGGTRVLDIAATAGSGSSPGGSASILKPFIVFDNTTHSGDTLTFKVTGQTGFALSEGRTYLCYHNGTDIINTGLGDVTLTGTQTLTNKTLTAPKIGTSILDTAGNELALLTATGSAVNEITLANAATGNGPIISTTGDDAAVDLNLNPKGTGDVVLAADTTKVGDAGAAATLTSNGAGTLTVTTGGTEDLVLSTNSGTDSGTVTITDGTNQDITFAPNGYGRTTLTGQGKIGGVAEKVTTEATAATGTVNYDCLTQAVWYFTTAASGNWTLNIRGDGSTSLDTIMDTGESLTIAHIVTQTGTAYYNSAVQVDGSGVTPEWQGGEAPTEGNTNSLDVYNYTVIKTGSATFTVLASQTQFA